ncbi:MAG: hypothetical protein JXB88_20700 [Spirochaetales bacterium]|nr:hypothetical protein [Spirochaetales bacterium]
MKRTLIIAVCFVILLFNSFPLGVDVDELKSASGKQVTFINYTGENPQYTVEEILSWGAKMAKDLEAGKSEGKYYNFFSAIHVADPSETGKFDADIISISRYGGVNHIDTLRLILMGFFSYQYGYSGRDARTLAFFVTVYNAIHRGEISYLETKYKNRVMGYLDATNAGLATNYKEWPGKTKILVPLSEGAQKGDISSLDMGELTEDTIEALKDEEDKAIEEREDMIDLQERVIEEKEEKLEEDKGILEEDRTKLEEDKTKLEEDKTKLEEDKTKLEEDKEKVDEIKDEEERKKEEERIIEEEKRITDEEDRVTKEEDRVIKEEDRVTKEEDRITKEEDKIEEDRKDIEEDKKDLEKDKMIEEAKDNPEEFIEKTIEEKEKEEKIYKGIFYYLKIKEYLTGGHYNNELYKIDAPTQKIISESAVKNICGRKYILWDKGIVVITHTGSHEAGHYLTLLDYDTLDVLAKGTDNIFHRSFVEKEGSYVYAITIDGTNYYLGKYDESMVQVARSTEPIYADTFISFYRDKIFVNSSAKDILALSVKDLSLIEKINP